MTPEKLIGKRVPRVELGILQKGNVQRVNARQVFAKGRIVAIGVPGAYTPICTTQHIPDFVQNADRLMNSGYAKLICIAGNDPFVLDEWARQLDPKRKILFLADGNLAFARGLGMTTELNSLFLGERSERFMLITKNGEIEHFRLEPNVLTYSCTRAEDALAPDDDVCLI